MFLTRYHGPVFSHTCLWIVIYSTVYSGTEQRKHESSALLAFVRGIHRRPVNSPHKWPVTRKMFPFDDVIMSLCDWVPISYTDTFQAYFTDSNWKYITLFQDYAIKQTKPSIKHRVHLLWDTPHCPDIYFCDTHIYDFYCGNTHSLVRLLLV